MSQCGKPIICGHREKQTENKNIWGRGIRNCCRPEKGRHREGRIKENKARGRVLEEPTAEKHLVTYTPGGKFANDTAIAQAGGEVWSLGWVQCKYEGGGGGGRGVADGGEKGGGGLWGSNGGGGGHRLKEGTVEPSVG